MTKSDQDFVEAITRFRNNRACVKWIDVNDEPFPTCKPILVAWLDGTEIDQIEWMTYSGQNNFWNLNSSNLNTFSHNDPEHKTTMGPLPSHWMEVPYHVILSIAQEVHK